MAKKEKAKEKTMDLVDLKNAKLIMKLKGEVEVEKIIVWDNSDGQRGVIKASYLHLTVRGEKGEHKFVIGAKDQNLWMGKELKKAEKKEAAEVIEL